MKESNEVFDLLSILLNDAVAGEETSTDELLDKIEHIITGEVSTALNDSLFPRKSTILRNLMHLLNETAFFLQMRFLSGKTVIGIREQRRNSTEPILKALSDQSVNKMYAFSKNIPVIIYHDDIPNKINAINIHGNRITLTPDNYLECLELYKKNIDQRQLLMVFGISAQLKYQNIAFIYFPFFRRKKNKYLHLLESMVDIFYDIGNKNEMLKIYSEHNNKRMNYAFSKKFLSILGEVTTFLKSRQLFFEDKLKVINENVLNTIELELKNELTEIKENNLENIANLKESIHSIMAASANLNDALCELENNWNNLPSDIPYSCDCMRYAEKLALCAIISNDWEKAIEYINDLKARQFQYAYIFEMYLDQAKNKDLDKNMLQRLADEKINISIDAEFLVHAKANMLGTSYIKSNFAEAFKFLKYSKDGYENYLLGNYFITNNKEEAKKYYIKALRSNYRKAGDELVKLTDPKDEKQLRKLADKLIPEANVLYAKLLFEQNKRRDAILNLKLAAAFENLDAISQLADIYFFWKTNEGDEADYQGIALKLYLYLKKHGVENEIVNERLGTIYYRKKQFQKAFELLNNCTSKFACYYCGKMYQYGDGIAQDLEKARECMEKAQNMGHPQAAAEYQKIVGKIASKKLQVKRPAYHSTSTEKVVDEGCFITTATCKSIGRPDNCEELLMLKNFRDAYLISESDGPSLIMVYYAIAPEIVKLIEADYDALGVYNNIYNEYILKICDLIREKKLVMAKKKLIMMTASLWKKYPVILEDINLLLNIKNIEYSGQLENMVFANNHQIDL